MTAPHGRVEAGAPRHGPVVLATAVGAATGSRAAAAALTCAGSEIDRAGLLIDLADGRGPRPSLIATAAARALEERLAVNLPEAGVASRGHFCHLTLPVEPSGLDGVAAALPAVRDSVAVVHLPPHLLQQALEEPRIPATGALLRADLVDDRSLVALAVRDLIGHGLRVAVLKRPLGWIPTRRALLGALPDGGLPARARKRLLTDDKRFHKCYDGKDESEGDRQETPRSELQRIAQARRQQWPRPANSEADR